MNEKRANPMPSHIDADAHYPDDNLFDDSATEEFVDDAVDVQDEVETPALPKLTLRHCDDDVDDSVDAADDDSVQDQTEDDNDCWPWDSDVKGVDINADIDEEVVEADVTQQDDESLLETESDDDENDTESTDSSEDASDSDHEMAAIAADLSDHSAIEDVVLSMPIVQTPIEETLASFALRMDEEAANSGDAHGDRLEAEGPARAIVVEARGSEDSLESSAASDESQSGGPATGQLRIAMTPKRIGSGQLIPARLTWRPGDPFGDMGGIGKRRFRWDVMLTSAGITAACGLACIWLLRTILA